MPNVTVPLCAGWRLRQVRRREGAPEVAEVAATVPGCVHTDLLAAGVIPDPLADANEQELAWIAECDWAYSCDVELTPAMREHDRIELKFEGLDTLATISVNGDVVGETANMHRRYRFDITGHVRPGPNRLEVVLRSATAYCAAMAASEGTWPSASFGRPFNYLRKMACSWGWDWGPWLTTAGIWRPGWLIAWSFGRLSDIRTHVDVDTAGHGRLSVDVDTVVGHVATDARLRITLRDPNGIEVAAALSPVAVGTTRVELDPGLVDLWWPHTHGAQPLYELEVELLCSDDIAHDVKRQRVGFRTIRLDTSPDATGSAFTFVVNGRAIFVRGVNWIPDDVFVSRVTEADYRERLHQAVDANVDMIRVWGGGIYEDDRFYDACDELGLLVWQDFLFACAAYPEHLLAEEVEAEAHGNVSRLMHHPSLAIWNGNNENIWGFWDWGWQDVLQGRAWGAGFYHELLPRVCAELDPDRPYVPGSPWSGSTSVAPNADAHGCVHVWDVWNQLDLARYRDHAPRFVSEFGWQAPPSWATMTDAVAPEHFRRDSAAMRNHQKATDGDLKLDRGIRPRFGEVTELDAFWYAAQVVQARAVQTGVEHFRALRPYCMGTIWWQLNDCWPAASWALVDSAGRRKPAWFTLRQAYRPRLLTFQPRGDRMVVFAVNDSDSMWPIDTLVRRTTLEGYILASASVTVEVAPGCSHPIEIDLDVTMPDDPTDEVLVVGEGDDRAWWWFADDRELHLRRPEWKVLQSVDGRGVTLEITTDTVVRDLVLYPELIVPDASADRQCLDLYPGEAEAIRIDGITDDDQIERLLTRPACWHVAALLDR